MTITHTVTYTLDGRPAFGRIENQTRITRSHRLTYRGCERIIRRDCPGAIVTRVETMIAN